MAETANNPIQVLRHKDEPEPTPPEGYEISFRLGQPEDRILYIMYPEGTKFATRIVRKKI